MISIRGNMQGKPQHAVAVVRRDFLLLDRVESGIETIIREVCLKHRLTVTEIMSDRRARYISWPRQEAFYRASKETQMSLPAIGRAFGKDHTTVMHGIKAHAKRLGA